MQATVYVEWSRVQRGQIMAGDPLVRQETTIDTLPVTRGRRKSAARTSVVALLVLAAALLGVALLRPAADTGGSASPSLPGLHVGDRAPDFALRSTGGTMVTLRSLRGRRVLLNFWSTVCTPCRVEMPALQQAYRQLGGLSHNGPVVLGVDAGAEDPGTVARFAATHGVRYPLLLDPDLQVTIVRYQVANIPLSIALDSSGRVTRIYPGPLDLPQIVAALNGAA